MTVNYFLGGRDRWDAQALPAHSKRFRAYARQSVRFQHGVDQLGEWIGEDVKGERSAKNDPVVAMAWFLAQTISDKCQCGDCEMKRDVVTQLVYGRGVDDQALLRAMETPPAGKPMPVTPGRGRPRKRARRVA